MTTQQTIAAPLTNKNAWHPPAGVTLHNGEPVPPSMEFFEPPTDIGELRTVYSTLTFDRQPWGPGVRVAVVLGNLLGGVAVVLLAALAFAVAGQIKYDEAIAFGLVAGSVVGFIAMLIALAKTKFKHTATYVGKLGIWSVTVSGRRDKFKRRSRFRFENAVDLYTQQTRQFVNGVYTGTSYAFTWKNQNGGTAYVLRGQYRSQAGTPPKSDPYYFAVSAEIAWSQLLLEIMAKELESQGFILFRVNKKDTVSVGPGFIEFSFGSKAQRITVEEIGAFSLAQGSFSVKHKDAKWFSGKGKFSFTYSNMANARLFLLAIDRLCGLRFE